MDSSGPREGGGAMKPVILRVGIALVLSATGLIFARFVYRTEDREETSSASNPESSSSPSRNNDGEQEEKESLLDHQKPEIIRMNSILEKLQKKEHEMELLLERCCFLKDKEVRLVEQESMLVNEKSQLDFCCGEVSAMEEELKRGQDLEIVYLKLVGEIQESRSENWFLEGETKMLRIRVKELEGEVKDLKTNLDLLQKEKEVYMKSSENSEMVSVEDHRRVLEEYEDLKRKVNYLRCTNCNTCLKKELMRNGTKYEGDLALTVVADKHHGWGKRFMKKLKGCIGGHSEKVEPGEEEMFHSRRSCSSV
ncbi:hypothetical protein N665_0203s0038 [Sinapis alba]|nr:hypothetical protein N665_0203s0038 [Sinapis alba]